MRKIDPSHCCITVVWLLAFALLQLAIAQACSDFNVRLVDGGNALEGRVEFCYNGTWGTVCDDQWDNADAAVVCRQLGIPAIASVAVIMSFNRGSENIFLDEVECIGNETRLVDCTHNPIGVHDCSHSEDAGIRCLLEHMCNDSDIRLVDGSNEYEGRVELCLDGVRGTVCDDDWDIVDAIVVCRHFGMTAQYEHFLSYFGPGSGPILLDNVECNGTETNLNECSHNGISIHNCDHTEDVGVVCQEHTCTESDIRLMNGGNENEGRVEICLYGLWGTVCDDFWDIEDAVVVCRRLGMFIQHERFLSYFGPGSGPILLDNVECNGTETNLNECSHNGISINDCDHTEDVGVVCQACSDFSVRLVDGANELEGRVEFCYNGTWGTVCDDQWDNADAAVVCRQLGIPAIATVAVIMSFNRGSESIFLDEVDCIGNETRLVDCTHNPIGFHDCSHFEDAGVRCLVACNESDIRLVSGRNENEGRVEVCLDGLWGTVCDDLWDVKDATVVCRQLGIAVEYVKFSDFGPGSGVIVLDNVECDGTETNLMDCMHNGINVHNCDHTEDVGVVCQAFTCDDGEIRTIGGSDVREGRVEICINGTWFAACGDNWNEAEASVVCKQLGYSIQNSIATKLGRGNALTINCSGNENSLQECPISQSPAYCRQLAGIQCEAVCASERITTCCSGSLDCYVPFPEGCYCNSPCFEFGDCCRDILQVNDCFATPAECNDTDVRLMGGSSELNGRVEVCLGGHWGTVCNGDFWMNTNAAVTCDYLGFSLNDVYLLPTGIFGSGSDINFLDEVQCLGSESNLLDCQHSGIGNYNYLRGCEIVNIACKAECNDGEVRLVNGTSSMNGRVEVCSKGIWGSVCDIFWDDRDAAVFCRQLGFRTDYALATRGLFGEGNRPILISNVTCTGAESTLSECQKTDSNVITCAQGGDAGVVCGKDTAVQRCSDASAEAVSQIIEQTERFGSCQPYEGESNLCDSIFDSSMDYVYIPNIRDLTQAQIRSKLQSPQIQLAMSVGSESCRELVQRILCYYYFIPCGTNTTFIPPTSICEDECLYVVNTCPEIRIIGGFLNEDIDQSFQFIDCNNPSLILQPLSSCCTSAGVEMELLVLSTSSTSQSSSSAATVGGAVGGVLAAILAVIVAAVIFAVVLKRKKNSVRIRQLDILASPRLEDTEKGNSATLTSLVVPNPYSKQLNPSFSAGSVELPNKNRISSSYIRQLTGQMLISYDEIRLMESIGQGEFGVVYKAHLTIAKSKGSRPIPKVVAVKTLKGTFTQDDIDKMMDEGLKMKKFSHPNVLSLIGVCVDGGPAPYIVMPFMINGSVLAYLKKERGNLILDNSADEDQVLDIKKRLCVMCSQIASGMEYLASERFVHRDLATRNCMIDVNFAIKIADFGLTEDVYVRNYFRLEAEASVKLPVKWMAPESLQDGVFSEKSDVWSFGIVCWEIFSGGKMPYAGVDPLSLVNLLETGQRMPKPVNIACPPEFYEMMLKCWHGIPEQRPTFTELSQIISTFIEHIAGYLDINYNPFAMDSSDVVTNPNAVPGDTNGENTEPDSGIKIRVQSPSEDGSTDSAYV